MSETKLLLDNAIDKFCEREYTTESVEGLNHDNFSLYAVDCGGYDATNEVQFIVSNGEYKLVIFDYDDEGNWMGVTEFYFELKKHNILSKENMRNNK